MSQQEPMTRGEVTVAVQYDNLAVSLSADNVAWAPDVVKDMQNRVLEMFGSLLAETYKYELISTAPEWIEDTEEGDE